jgi:branched-chain amino acid transport system ATP-binding protein
MTALLEVQGLTKRFGGLVANNEISFSLDEGEVVGLIGPNGSGKTTLFSCLSGFYRPDDGRVRFGGRDVTGWAPERMLHAGLARTFQIVRTFPEMSVLENVMVGAFARTHSERQARAAARDLLEFTHLAAKSSMRASDLTIADKKRLEVARALATRPLLLTLDEVMAGLTPFERQEAVALVRAINARGIAVLLVEHVMEVIMPISRRVIVLDSGRKIAEDAPDVIVRNADVIAAYLGDKYRAAD